VSYADEMSSLGVLAGTFGRNARVYHVGFVVPDLDEAIATLGPVLGVHFMRPAVFPFPVLETPLGPREVSLRLSYSTQPMHVELIGSAPGSLWDFEDRRRGHHVGVWSDDIANEAERLDRRGMPRLWWVHGPDGNLVFSYHDTPYGFYIELVNDAFRAGLADTFRSEEIGHG
jgi:catechol 2,3-dioxygenase-like lactoylglutathione lyase family enzyme